MNAHPNKLFETIRKLAESASKIPIPSPVEIAADDDIILDEDVFVSDSYQNLFDYYEAVIIRQNEFLDRKKMDVFSDVLNLTTRGQMERATTAYSKDYLMSLGLSLEATSDLAQQLIILAVRWKCAIPEDWRTVAGSRDLLNMAKKKLRYLRTTPEM